MRKLLQNAHSKTSVNHEYAWAEHTCGSAFTKNSLLRSGRLAKSPILSPSRCYHGTTGEALLGDPGLLLGLSGEALEASGLLLYFGLPIEEPFQGESGLLL